MSCHGQKLAYKAIDETLLVRLFKAKQYFVELLVILSLWSSSDFFLFFF